MGRLSSLLWGAAIGAGIMYFKDPQNGERRKAMVRDQIYHLRSKGDDAIETAISDLRQRANGLLAEGMALVSEENVPDRVLEERVRSRLGFLSRHPGALQISVQDRTVNLSGDVLAPEVDHLMKGVGRVRGIKNVQNNLRVHQEAGNIPQLQGEGWMPGDSPASKMWSPSTRLLAGSGALYLVTYGMARGGLIGLLARLGGMVLGARALTNMDMKRLTGMTSEGDAVRVRKSIEINAPAEEVYQLWSKFENFPRFMNNIESIRDTGNKRSHWVVKGPVGSKVEFDAVTTEMIPNELVAWETTPDSQVKHKGQVRFRSTGQNRTQVNVTMNYTPPAGAAGHAVATLFGKDPKSEMDADLARMKSLLEEGKTTAGEKVRREEVMPVTGESSRQGSGTQGSGKQGGGKKSNRKQNDDDVLPVTGRMEDELTDRDEGLESGFGSGTSDYDEDAPLAREDE